MSFIRLIKLHHVSIHQTPPSAHIREVAHLLSPRESSDMSASGLIMLYAPDCTDPECIQRRQETRGEHIVHAKKYASEGHISLVHIRLSYIWSFF